MKTRYKIPIIVALCFIAVWPQMPHIIWFACEILPDCSNDTSYVSGINFFGIPIETNLFVNHDKTPLGLFALSISFASIAYLIIWRIRK